ncbi:MAG: VWA domain-containing protein [Planctomycetes bacterium]|nr:VWA domain-containing protein [Planctomycetota bacterium]
MEAVRFAIPWSLLAAPAAWGIILYAALGRGPRRAGAAWRAVLGCVAAGMLALAIAGPSVRVSQEGRCPVVILQDVSPSVAAHRAEDAAGKDLAPFADALPPGRAGLVFFSGAAETHAAPVPGAAGAQRRLTSAALAPPARLRDAADTDIHAALLHAGAALPGGRGIILLYSDGRETRGNAIRAAQGLAARGTRIFTAAPRLQPRDVRIAGISATAAPATDKPVAIEVRLASTVPAAATVRLERAAGPSPAPASQTRDVQVDPAAGAAVLFQDAPPAPGLYLYHAHVLSAADEWPENNRASCMVQVGRGYDVLYIHGGDAPGAAMEALLAAAPAHVRLHAVPAARFAGPSAAEAVAVLDNVAAWSLPPDVLQRLAARVADGGLGFLALGGDAAFGAGGYADSPLEDLLPVSSRVGRRPAMDVVFVIDSSGSMNEVAEGFTKLVHAKSAVLDLGSALGPQDRVAVVAFAGEPRVAAPLLAASEWERLRQALVSIEAGGGTRITPAALAALGLFGPGAPPAADTVRHVLLLSDGRSEDFDVPRLADACRRTGATLSAVATGPDADRERLGRLARDAGGRLYHVTGAARQILRETFLGDMAQARGEGLTPGARPAQWRHAGPVWRQPGPPLPAVNAVNPTQPKPAADVLWQASATGGGDPSPLPLLAAWRKGLGRAAAMPWPVGQPPAAWQQDGALGAYLAAVVEWLRQEQSPEDWSARLEARDGAWWVRAEQRAGALAKPPATFVAAVFDEGAAAARQVTLEHVAPGVHEAKVGSLGSGAALAVVHRRAAGQQPDADAQGAARLPVPGLPPPEYERLGVDRAHLEAIARAGSGRLLEPAAAPDALAEIVRRAETEGYQPISIFLVAAAGAAVLLQAVLRLAGRI